MRRTIPIFPLHSVLFPGGPLELRIFETRYLDMISRCLKEGSGFGVSLIREGQEVGGVAEVYDIGTYGEITYWNRRNDGMLWITVTGRQRFRILETRIERDNLLVAEVEMLPADEEQPVPRRWQALVPLLTNILDRLDHPYITLPRHYGDAGWVASRLGEVLPLPSHLKQHLLQQDDPLERLERIFDLSEKYLNGD